MSSPDDFRPSDRPEPRPPVRFPLLSAAPGPSAVSARPRLSALRLPTLRQPTLRQPAGRTGDGPLASALRRVAAARRPSRPVETVEAAPSAADRRAFPRRDSGCRVLVCRWHSDAPPDPQHVEWELHSGRLRGDLLDVSMNGAAFRLDEPVEPGECLELRLTNPRLDHRTDMTAQVVRCLAVGPNQWKIVCRFRRHLTFEQVHELGRLLRGRIV